LFTWVNLIVVIFAVVFPFIFIYRIIQRIKARKRQEKEMSSKIASQEWNIRDLFRKYYLEHIQTEEWIKILKRKLGEIRNLDGLTLERERLKKALKDAENNLIKWRFEEAVLCAQLRREQEEKKLREIQREKERTLEEIKDSKKTICEKLEKGHNRVFEKARLSKIQIEALKSEGYKFVNEFSIIEKRRITILIKPFGGHSYSHEFLVWDMKRLLSKTKGITNIKEHLTKEADITFTFKNRRFAIEVEIGSLLRKSNQLKEKVKHLNKFYSKRWMFVVSHRDFVPKYRKFGFTSPRNRVCEKLEKLLKIAHT
jgi:hypothetical protein